MNIINFKNIKFTALVVGIFYTFIIFDSDYNQLALFKFNYYFDELANISLTIGQGLEGLIIAFMPYISLRIYESFYRNEDK